jgi:hypothetical protein
MLLRTRSTDGTDIPKASQCLRGIFPFTVLLHCPCESVQPQKKYFGGLVTGCQLMPVTHVHISYQLQTLLHERLRGQKLQHPSQMIALCHVVLVLLLPRTSALRRAREREEGHGKTHHGIHQHIYTSFRLQSENDM